jgi:cell wall-associated NlpC family hydrolase
VPITPRQRVRILREARRWIGVRYDDGHTDTSWRARETSPTSFDCSTFVCRVAMEALGYGTTALAPDAGWLIEHLMPVSSPEPGDLVGYERAATPDEIGKGYDRVWHVMLYAGNGQVIGACDAKRAVVMRPIDYKPVLGPRQWRFVGHSPAPFRRLELRG